MSQRSELTAAQDLPGPLPGRDLGKDEVDGVYDACVFDGAEHLSSLIHTRCHGLLAEDVLARGRRGQDDRRLQSGRDRDRNRIDQGVGEESLQSPNARGIACRAATSCARSAVLAQIPTIQQRPSDRNAGMWTCCPYPMPIRPMEIDSRMPTSAKAKTSQ